jgi:hypothetical protein
MRLGLPRPQLSLERFQSYRFLGLLLALLLLLIASPFVGSDQIDRAILSTLLAIVLFSAVGAASTARHQRWIAAGLASAGGIVIGGGLLLEHRIVYLPGLALLTIYLVYTIGVVLRRIVTASQIDADILCGAAAVYLMLGVAWAMSYWMIYLLDNNALTVVPALATEPIRLHEFLYYSLSCLTTLGIGDITPVNHFAQIWTTLETVAGNLYIAVLVSRLVSLYR